VEAWLHRDEGRLSHQIAFSTRFWDQAVAREQNAKRSSRKAHVPGPLLCHLDFFPFVPPPPVMRTSPVVPQDDPQESLARHALGKIIERFR
jgi:hypothetical protein